ncbi:hypothetical protein KAF25_001474 [Fusarium avenaceum]|uniref:NB-ARC domain-containing protein n=1 Tax=Fusarium avenaceum TaxID=40199 RepID=A0A9P7KV24_9HYPO|nr:hypothetical protein KAF25_001474 [Fusarium avenaceum]
MSESTQESREVSNCQFGDHTIIHQGNVQGNVYYRSPPHPPYPPARAEVVRVIPYPRNEDIVHRRDLIDKLDEFLPQSTSGSYCAALWGLGGSGKTQIALDYAYRRCDTDKECCIFWVHADSEATFLADYKTIGKKLGVDEQLDGTDLLEAVCDEIEGRSKWLLILDNADDLKLFRVGVTMTDESESQNLYKYVPCTSHGTVLWTSRDAHIAGTLVGASRSIQVQSMEKDEATTLLATTRGDQPVLDEAGIDGLLEELQCLPLAVSQAGAYMRRMSMTAEEYLSRLKEGNSRWEVLKVSDTDRHRRPEASNSVLETWRISTERIRAESEMSYRILHVIAYVDNQDIPDELIAEAANEFNHGRKNDQAEQKSDMQVSEFEVLTAVARLKEFSFLRLRQTDDGRRNYEMHKLVQEALRYGLSIQSLIETARGSVVGEDGGAAQAEALYSGRALEVVAGLLPAKPASSVRCEQYLTHAVRVGEWAEVGKTEIETANMLARVSLFLYERQRWTEKESVDSRVWSLRRRALTENHPDTLRSMADFGVTRQGQGRAAEAHDIAIKVLKLQQEILGEEHPDTIRSLVSLGVAYQGQGRHDEAEKLYNKVLKYHQGELGERQSETISNMADLGMLGEMHPDTLRIMAGIGVAYYAQGRHTEAHDLTIKVLELRQKVLGEHHPDTISSKTDLGAIYYVQGRYEEATRINEEALQLRREILGPKHPTTIRNVANIATIYYRQGKYDEALQLHQTALDLRREVLGETHPDTIQSVEQTAYTREMLRRLKIRKLERELKLWDRLFWEIMNQKVRQIWKRRSHKDQDIN